jgi:hypothetical protein
MRGTKIKEGITKHSDILMLTCFITMCICVFALVLCYIYAGENAKLRMAFDVILFISIVLELIASAIYEKYRLKITALLSTGINTLLTQKIFQTTGINFL